MLLARRDHGTERLDTLGFEALSLPESDRTEMAHTLVSSLDAPVDHDAADAWEKEIVGRLAEIDSGTAQLIDRDEFRRQIHDQLDKG